MSKYDRKLIYDYVYGNDIDGYDIDKLEDDYEFMMEVIDYTMDKNIYNLCSDNVKNNYDFLKFMINKFRMDLNFVCNIVDEYLKNEVDDFTRTELVLIVCNLTENINSECYKKYQVLSETIYFKKKLSFELVKVQEQSDSELINEFGMGFLLILDSYSSSDVIMNFYTKHLISDIFSENGISLEELLHRKFNKFEEVEKIGLNNYILSFLNTYDSNLSAYVSCHIEMLNDIKETMDKIKSNWDSYNFLNERKKYNKLLTDVHNYMYQHGDECSFDETEILYYIGDELSISDKILKYDGISNAFYNDIVNNFTIDKKEMDFNDFRHYHAIRQLMLGIIEDEGNKDVSKVDKSNNDGVAKILKFDFKNNKLH